jgi:hypothetical protein
MRAVARRHVVTSRRNDHDTGRPAIVKPVEGNRSGGWLRNREGSCRQCHRSHAWERFSDPCRTAIAA